MVLGATRSFTVKENMGGLGDLNHQTGRETSCYLFLGKLMHTTKTQFPAHLYLLPLKLPNIIFTGILRDKTM